MGQKSNSPDIVLEVDGSTMTIGPRDVVREKYESLILSLDKMAENLQRTDKSSLLRVAYCLGALGQKEASDAILKWVREKKPYEGYGMYGFP